MRKYQCETETRTGQDIICSLVLPDKHLAFNFLLTASHILPYFIKIILLFFNNILRFTRSKQLFTTTNSLRTSSHKSSVFNYTFKAFFFSFLTLVSESRIKNISEKVFRKSLMEAFEKSVKPSHRILSSSFSLSLVDYRNFSKNFSFSQLFESRLAREQKKSLTFT